MEIKRVQLVPTGMNQDISVSKFTPNLSFYNRNIRITARETNTLMSIENEMGNLQIPLKNPDGGAELNGTCIGYTVLNNYIVIFTTLSIGNNNSVDRIYRIDQDYNVVKLFEGDLGFDTKHPIECIPFYETEYVQKVYWTDSKNQLRVINIAADEEEINKWTNTSFNFSQDLSLDEVVTITKNNTGGQFAAGVIQYAFTYYNISGPESNIFQTSDLYYLSASDRALDGESVSNNSFTININNIDTNFEYLRVYSIHRSSLNATPTVKIVIDYKIVGDTAVIQDTGYYGDDIDSTKLLYVGGEEIIAGTITSKDNTLFAGNIQIQEDASQEEIILDNISKQVFNWEYRDPIAIEQKAFAKNGLYTYLPESLFTKASDFRHFKSGQTYRLGVQFQRANGKWSDPVYLGGNNFEKSWDRLCDKPFLTEVKGDETLLYLNKGVLTLDPSMTKVLANEGYKRVRPIVVMPELSDRTVIAQGLLTSTIGFDRKRESNNSFAYVDHVARPYKLGQNFINEEVTQVSNPSTFIPENWYPTYLNSGHFLTPAGGYEFADDYHAFGISSDNNNEYKYPFIFRYHTGNSAPSINRPRDIEIGGDNPRTLDNACLPFIDENIVSFWSPELQYNETIDSYLDDTSCVIAGLAGLSSSSSSIGATVVSGDTEGASPGYISRGTYDTATNWEVGSKLKVGVTATGLKYNDEGNQAYAQLPIFSPESFSFDSRAAAKDYDVKSKNTGWLQYSLANLMFDTTKESLTLPIYKPQQVLRTESLIPYSTASVDNGGTITYNTAPDEIFLADVVGEYLPGKNSINAAPKPAVYKFKSNSHAVFSFKEAKEEGVNYSLVIPEFYKKTTRTLAKEDPTIYSLANYRITLTITKSPYYTDISGNDKTEAAFDYEYSVVNASNDAGWPSTYVNSFKITFSTTYGLNYGTGFTAEGTVDFNIFITGMEGSGTSVGKIPEGVPLDREIVLDVESNPGFQSTSTTITGGNGWKYVGNAPQFPVDILNGGSGTQNFELAYSSYNPGGGGDTDSLTYITPFWRDSMGYLKHSLNIDDIKINNPANTLFSTAELSSDARFLILAELRRNVKNPYGGYTKEAIDSNLWLPAGPSVKILDGQEVKVEYLSGDTFVGRYDCLRTFSDTSYVQEVFNVVSFLCESYINLDGRYDRNRYNIDVRDKNDTNYGLVNEVYSQRDNYFTYRTLNLEQFKSTKFPTQVLWSLTKSNGELVDSWTNLNLTSTLDLEGSLGPLNSLKTLNSEIIAFQDKGISNILFNSRVQIPTSDEIPIEIGNNYKVSGYRYITNQIGAKNKWSINQTKNGLYFMDDLNKTMNVITGSGIMDLSVEKGFKTWSNNNIADYGSLVIGTSDGGSDTNQMNTFSTSVDKLHNDIYFTNSSTCLCYSEIMGNFTSFYDYGNIPFMFNYQDDFISVRNTGIKTQLYLQNVGKFNEFFGNMYPSEIDYIVCPDEPLDKVFNNIEFRADCFARGYDPTLRITEDSKYRITEEGFYRSLQGGKPNGYSYIPFRTLDKVECENEFQYGVFDWANQDKFQLRKKFRIWRSALPRSQGTLDRIRNPWTHIKLHYRPDQSEDNRLILHDIIVNYTVI